MRLIDALKKEKEDTVAYIGTNRGCGFIYIAEVRDVIKNINKLENYLRNKTSKIVNDAENKIYDIPFRIVEIRNEYKNKNMFDEEEKRHMDDKIEELNHEFARAYNIRKKYVHAINNWTTIGNRTVITSYPHETDIPGVTFIVQGLEFGELHYKHEVDEKAMF